ncbi:unnamed protein product, partial [Laminaria digitata]
QNTSRRKKRADTIIAELQAQLNISFLPSRPTGASRVSPYPNHALRARVAPMKGPWSSRPSPRPSPPTGRAKLKVRECGETSVENGVLPGRGEGRADDASEAAAGDRAGRNGSKVSSLLVPARPSGGRTRGDTANAGSYVAADALAVLDDAAAANGLLPSAGGRKRRRNSGKGVLSGSSSSCGDGMSVGRWSSTDHGGDREKDQGGEADNPLEMLPPPDRSDVSSADVWSMLNNYVHRRVEVAKANRHVRAIEAMRR